MTGVRIAPCLHAGGIVTTRGEVPSRRSEGKRLRFVVCIYVMYIYGDVAKTASCRRLSTGRIYVFGG